MISVFYSGDPDFSSSTGKASETVSKIATILSLSSSATTSMYEQNITFTATLTPGSGAVPDGEVITFQSGAIVLGTATLSGGVASLTTSALSAGSHAIKATSNGDATLVRSSAGVAVRVIKAPTTLTLTVSPNPGTAGQPFAMSASIRSGAGTPSGRVTFKSGTITLATTTLSGGMASTSAALMAGSYVIKAVYAGSPDYVGSSDSVTEVVH